MNDAAASLFAGIVADKAEAARRALAKVPPAVHEAWLSEFHAEADTFHASTLKERLDAFRAHVGEDHYNQIAGGPSLAPMLETWVQGEKLAIGERAVGNLIALAAAYAYPSSQTLGRAEAAAYFGELLISDRSSQSPVVE
jgi:hypothetical protein